jgi:cytosine/adenosine deaminase-related metal-dependent hydrolase
MNGWELAMNPDQQPLQLLRAAWVIPINSPPVQGGAVLVKGSRITAVGAHSTLLRQAPAGTRSVDCGDAAILPALVNAHTHLELTALGNHMALPQPGFPAWLRTLLPLRAALSEEQRLQGSLEGHRQLLGNGVAVYGDVTNRLDPDRPTANGFPRGHVFVEVLGFDGISLQVSLEGLGAQDLLTRGAPQQTVSLAAHACYSTSAALIQAAKGWDREHAAPFSIHVAEHPEEMQFLRDGSGFCRELLESLGRWAPGWKAPGESPVAYLNALGVLDERTLLVHAVHLTERDWQMVAERRCRVCFCPRSNASLQVGQPAIETAVALGIPAALGTDSLASNTDLSLFAEAAFVLEHHPGVAPEAIITMATLGGARALQQHADFGSIEAGKRAALLAVQLPSDPHPEDLIATLIQQGHQGAWQWIPLSPAA